MVNVFMADEHKHVFKLLQQFSGDLLFRFQFTVFPAPIVKNHKRPFARDGKTAVVIMGDQQILLHADAHLHGIANSILRLSG